MALVYTRLKKKKRKFPHIWVKLLLYLALSEYDVQKEKRKKEVISTACTHVCVPVLIIDPENDNCTAYWTEK